MYVLFEEEGMFKTGHIMSESDAALQVESESGKRSKIKRTNCLFTFASPTPDILMPEAQRLSEEIELQFLWECAPQDEFDIETLGTDYFGHPINTLEKTTLLLRLHSAPIYFHRRGRGRYRPAPPEILTAALAAQEKKQMKNEQMMIRDMTVILTRLCSMHTNVNMCMNTHMHIKMHMHININMHVMHTHTHTIRVHTNLAPTETGRRQRCGFVALRYKV
jgi:hypothetical protein